MWANYAFYTTGAPYVFTNSHFAYSISFPSSYSSPETFQNNSE
jgi:hypothetical protein